MGTLGFPPEYKMAPSVNEKHTWLFRIIRYSDGYTDAAAFILMKVANW